MTPLGQSLRDLYSTHPLVMEAAEAIESLTAERDRLREALEPFYTADWYADGYGGFRAKMAASDLDRAKAAYEQSTRRT